MQSKSSSSQKVGLFSAIIICMNAMIGAGIFTTPAKLALSVGPAGIITYLIVIAAVLCMALSLSRVAFLYPEEGSFYTYTKQWGGHFLGILSAGAYITGIIIAMGLLIQMVIQYIPPFIPYVHDLDPRILGTIILIIISSLNIAGIRIMQTGQFLLIGCTLFALFSTIFVCLSNANTQNLKPFMPYGWTSLIKATSAAIFAFFGFESAASLYSVVQNPEKNVPRALTASLIIVGTIYLTFISSIILAIPKEIFTNPRIPVSQAIIAAFDGYHFLAQFIGLKSDIHQMLQLLQHLMDITF